MTVPEDITVDIGMPTLGMAQFLPEAIDSIRAQTFTAWRLTVSENGPPSSELRSVLAGYTEDSRIRHRVVGELVSMSANWTRAMEGDAKYVAMLHDDDRWGDEFLARRVEFLEANPTCGFVFGGIRVIDESGKLIQTIEHDVPSGPIGRDTIFPIVYENCIVAPPTALVRRAAYEAVGPAFKEVFLNDHEMWIRLSARFDVGYLPVADSEYRFHGTQNTTRNRTRIGAGQLEVIDATDSLPIAPSVRRRAKTRAHLLSAYDDAELGRHREALGHLRAAVASQPSILVRPQSVARMILVVATVALGERGRRWFSERRARRFMGRTGRPSA